MASTDKHLTRGHLLRRLLQRRVELLEAEKAELKAQVQALEARLTRVEPSATDSASEQRQESIAAALEQVRTISERAQSEATATVRETRLEHTRLVASVEALLQDSHALERMLLEAVEGVHSIAERTQTITGQMVREAHHREEQLARELEQHFAAEESASPSTASPRVAPFDIRARAERVGRQLQAEAASEREALLQEIHELHQRSEELRETLALAISSARAIAHRTQGAAEREVPLDILSLGASPSFHGEARPASGEPDDLWNRAVATPDAASLDRGEASPAAAASPPRVTADDSAGVSEIARDTPVEPLSASLGAGAARQQVEEAGEDAPPPRGLVDRSRSRRLSARSARSIRATRKKLDARRASTNTDNGLTELLARFNNSTLSRDPAHRQLLIALLLLLLSLLFFTYVVLL